MTTPHFTTARGSMIVGAVVLALLTASCAGTTGGDASTKPAGGAATAVTGTAGPTAEVTETPAVVIPRPVDVIAGTYVPVKRNGKAPTISAPAGSFTKPVRYPDGTTLAVTSIKQGVVSGKGPGVFPGQPTTSVALTLTNGSAKPISLDQVVVTATYGSPKRVASPVYDSTAADFGGTVAPGSSRRATYKFSIPTAALGSVVMFVDFDAVHVFATLAGSAK